MYRTWDGKLKFHCEVTDEDLVNLKLDAVDLALMRDCGREDRTAADWLLALEMIFRRGLEQGLEVKGPDKL
jgi:hypothetical protein